MPQTDRPLGEMSDEELCEIATNWLRAAQHPGVPDYLFDFYNQKHWIARDELSRRERRSAPRETGASDDA